MRYYQIEFSIGGRLFARTVEADSAADARAYIAGMFPGQAIILRALKVAG